MATDTQSWLGKGLYSPREASRLLVVPVKRIESWLSGRSWVSRGVVRSAKPVVIGPEARMVDDRLLMTFVDLIELLFIKGFRDRGLSLQYIRAAAENAAQLFDTDHPFTLKRFATDRRRIFSTLRVNGNDRTLELVGGQLLLPEFWDRYLHQLEYDVDTGSAIRWWPLGKQRLVCLDPQVSFGAPTVRGVPTETLAAALSAYSGDARAVADWYEIVEEDVRAAAAYENALSEQRAA